jgi:chromatin segregation and condensation protein Rec8/ScpA/Scc1 (kleisin family)
MGSGRPEVRLRKLAPSQRTVEQAPPPPAAAPVEEDIAAAAPPQESAPEYQEYRAEQALPDYQEPLPETSADLVWTNDPEPVQEPTPTQAGMPVPQVRKLARPTAAAEPSAETAPEAKSLPYQPDTNLENIYRRQWWKYDLKVKSKRIQPAEAKGQE